LQTDRAFIYYPSELDTSYPNKDLQIMEIRVHLHLLIKLFTRLADLHRCFEIDSLESCLSRLENICLLSISLEDLKSLRRIGIVFIVAGQTNTDKIVLYLFSFI